jgi:pyruvate dehydrogenase E1 component alpha subunit
MATRVTAGNDIDALQAMLLARELEAVLLQRPDCGFQLLSAGQEAVAVGVAAALLPQDQLLCSGRSIAPALARGLDPGRVMAELIGRASGPCQGRGGRGHLSQPSAGFFGAHAVVAGNLSIAAGVALALQARGERSIAVCLFGDGACGAGALHETMNIASLWKLPLLLVCDNNLYSVSTPRAGALAPRRLSDLAQPFAIEARTVDGMDVRVVREAAVALAARVRSGAGPAFLECISRRFASHSTSARETRQAQELAADRKLDPITRLETALLSEGALNARTAESLREQVRARVTAACAFAEASPLPVPHEAFADVG